MRNIAFTFIFLSIIVVSCFSNGHESDEILAGNQAADFMKILFIDTDIHGAYKYLLPKFQNEFPFDEFNDSFGRMAKKAKVIELDAISYDIINELNDIAIYISARNRSVSGKFEVILRGDKRGYKVVSIKTIANDEIIDKKPYKLFREKNVIIQRRAY
jgi:hypothetical protein